MFDQSSTVVKVYLAGGISVGCNAIVIPMLLLFQINYYCKCDATVISIESATEVHDHPHFTFVHFHSLLRDDIAQEHDRVSMKFTFLDLDVELVL